MAPVMTNSIVEDMNEWWLKTLEEKQAVLRLKYLQSFVRSCSHYCPECGGELESSEDEDESYCTSCGLVTSASTQYVAGQKIDLPYGLRL